MNVKALLAERAVALVDDGCVVGLGTGSTANAFVDALAARHRQGLRVTTVASSTTTARRAQTAGLPLQGFEHTSALDLYVDGADEIAPDLTLLKGRGADLVREKLLARAAARFVVLGDSSKLVDRVGAKGPIPVEVLPFAWQIVQRVLRQRGVESALRENASKDGLFMSSAGNLVLEAVFLDVAAAAIDDVLNGVPGVVEHGVFVGLVARAFVVGADGVITDRQPG